MKKIIAMLVLTMVIIGVSCSEHQYYVYVEDGIDTAGIDAWKQDVVYVDKDGFYSDDVTMEIKQHAPNVKVVIVDVCIDSDGMPIEKWGGSERKEVWGSYIQIKKKNIKHTNVIAHEFGHTLWRKHTENEKSIMYPIIRTFIPMCDYIEFK